jgi:hypothetical protein
MAPVFRKEFQPQTKGILVGGKWIIWDVDRNGSPSHGNIEAIRSDSKIGDIQAEISHDGLNGFLRVRKEMSYRDAVSKFLEASAFNPSEFELTIELPSGAYSSGTIDQWTDKQNNPPKHFAPSTWLKLLKKWLDENHSRYFWQRPWSGVKLSESRLANTQNKKDPRAFCYVIVGQKKIHHCKALALLPDQFIVGILLHEIGHILQVEDDPEVDDPEVDCDELILSRFPEAGYHYADARYTHDREKRVARNIECVSEKFLKELTR